MSTLAEQAAMFRELRIQKDAVTARAAKLAVEYKEAEIRLFERMESEGVGGLRLDELGVNLVRAETIYAKVQDRSAFVNWAREHMPEAVEERERNADGLLNELVREYTDDGRELPPGLGVSVKQYVSQRVA